MCDSGVRMLCDKITPEILAKALSYGIEKFDIYSSSWNPPDNGHFKDSLTEIEELAYIKGTTEVSIITE